VSIIADMPGRLSLGQPPIRSLRHEGAPWTGHASWGGVDY